MISPMLSQLNSFSAEQRPCIWRPDAIVSLILLITFLAWDSTSWDMYLATMWGEPSGFALRDHWWMAKIMHAGARNLGWVFLVAMLIGIWRPWGALRALATADRVSLFLSVLSALLCDLDQRLQSNKLPMGPPSFWRGGALRVSLEPVGSRWRRRSLLSGRSRIDRLRLHGRLLWASAKQCAGRCEVAACGRVHRIYFGNFTTNARRALHEPHPLDSLVVLDCGLVKSCTF